MAFAVRDRTETTLSEINVTPLVDVMLVLLIIFMVTAPMLSAGVDVSLQQASVAPPPTAKERVIVTISADKRIYVADQLTDVSLVTARLKETMARTSLRDVAIRADKSVDYGFVLAVLDRLRVAEVRSVGLVMAPPQAAPSLAPGGRR